MKMIRPATVTDAVFTSSNVIETAPAAYSAGTTYAIGDQVAVFTGTTAALYESLANGNIGNTPSSSPLVWEPIGSTYAVYNGGTTYSAGDRVISTTTHRAYESIVGSNTGQALSDPTKWLDIGPTNKWALVDTVNGTVTTHPIEVDVTFDVTGRVDAISLHNLINVVEVQVIVSTVLDGEVYNETFSTLSTAEINDWHSYFFEELVRKDTLTITGIPIRANPIIQVILSGSGDEDMSVGTLIFGQSKYLGETMADGASVGITDFSIKEADDFGNYILRERAFAKRGVFRIMMPGNTVDDFHKTLSEYRATPTLWSASDDFSSTNIFGFYRDFSVGFEHSTFSYGTLEIEGLT